MNNGYKYTLAEFQLRNEYRKTDNVFGRFIDKAEKAGKAVPISLREHEMKYGYLTSRLMMMGTAIETGLMLADPMGKPFSVGGSRYFSQTIGATGSQGVKALTNANTGWNSFLKANTGKSVEQVGEKELLLIIINLHFIRNDKSTVHNYCLCSFAKLFR